MTDGTKREDDTLSGGSALITLCLGLIHKSIVVNEQAPKKECELERRLTDSECRTAASDVTHRKRIKTFPVWSTLNWR